MRVNKSIQTKEKRRFALDHMAGVDFSSSPLNCAPMRSPDAVNWIGDHGINRKRHGWEQVTSRFYSVNGIRSIFQINEHNLYVDNGSTHILLERNSETNEWTDSHLIGKSAESKPSLFSIEDKTYIVDGLSLRYLYYDEDAPSQKWKVGAIDPYIPTTTINIGRIGDANDKRSTKDLVNLLTRKRRNTLVGSKLGSMEKVMWRLDGRPLSYYKTVIKWNGDTYSTIPIATAGNVNLFGTDFYKLDNDGGVIEDQDVVFSLLSSKSTFIVCTVDTSPDVEDEANITVEFDADIEDRSDRINGCTFGTLFGVGGARDRLFLSGNPKYPNVVFFSNFNDPTYFPDQYTITFGTDAEPITGMLQLSDGVLAVMKRNAIYYISGEYNTTYDDVGNVKRTLPIFSITTGSINEGCLNPFAVANFGTDDLFVSRNGVFAIQPTSDVLTNTRVARERSRPIASRFPLANAENVTCFVHGQRLYVSDGSGACYVADTSYKYMPEGSEDYSYEWWCWDNIPATTWAEVNGELWFGTFDGRICRFTDGYVDSTYDYTASGEIAYNNALSVVYDEADNVGEIVDGRRVRFTTAGWRDAIGDLTEVDLYAHIEEVIPDDENPTDPDDKNYVLRFSRYADATSNEYITFEKNGTNPILRVYNDKPVVAEWTSPPLDFGTDAFSKTLFSLTVTAETGKNSLLEFGYETRKRAESFTASGLGVFSFEDMDFSAFSFESGFQNSYTVRARDRNFNFLRFRLRSDGNKPCAVHRISALYKINKQNKGVV